MHPLRALLLAGGAAAVAAGLIVVVWDGPAEVTGNGGPPPSSTRFSAREVIRIRLERPDATLELVPVRGRWRIVKPRRLSADPAAVLALLRRCARLRPARTVGTPGNLASFGLAPPRVRVVLTLRGGRRRTIDLGAPEPFAGGAFARLGAQGPVVVIDAAAAAAIDRDLGDLRDRRLFRVSLRQAHSFRIQVGNSKVELRRVDGGQWAVGESAPAEAVEVRSFLALLTELRAERYLAEGTTDPKAFGLDNPDATVTLSLDGRRVRLLLERQASGRVAATVPGSGVVAEVSEAIWRSVTRAPEAWRSSRALHFFRRQVGGLRISHKGRLVILSRSRTGSWELLTPRAGAARSKAVRMLLRRLGRLHARAGAPPGTLGALGLAPAQVEILLEDRRGRLLDGLRLGRTRKGLRAAQSVRWPRPFWVAAAAVQHLPLEASDFRKAPGRLR